MGLGDLNTLQGFIEAMPESHLAYFHPHGFGRADLTAVLRSRSHMTYGLLNLAPQCRLAKRPPSGSRLCVIAELPNDYLLIEFPMVERERPVLGKITRNPGA